MTKDAYETNRESPFVSILMPLRNEAVYLHDTLQAVIAQDYPRFEILIIDGDSDDRTCEIVQQFQRNHGEIIHLLHNPGRWQSKALNIGLQAAKGDIIIRVDGHTIIAPDYVRQVVNLLMRDSSDSVLNVGGLQRAVGTTRMGQAIALANRSRFAVPSAFKTANQDRYVDTVYMGAWRRDVLHRLGGWDESYPVHEDYELNYRLRKAGGRIWLSQDLKSLYYCRDNLVDLWQQYYRYGQGKALMLRQHPASLRPRHIIAPLFMLLLAGGLVGAVWFVKVRMVWLLILALYSVISLCVSVYHARGHLNLLWRLPVIFLTIHTAWGLGFWKGLSDILRS